MGTQVQFIKQRCKSDDLAGGLAKKDCFIAWLLKEGLKRREQRYLNERRTRELKEGRTKGVGRGENTGTQAKLNDSIL